MRSLFCGLLSHKHCPVHINNVIAVLTYFHFIDTICCICFHLMLSVLLLVQFLRNSRYYHLLSNNSSCGADSLICPKCLNGLIKLNETDKDSKLNNFETRLSEKDFVALRAFGNW